MTRTCLFVLLFSSSVSAVDGERRALWVVRDALKSRESVDRVLTDALSGRFTDLFVQVRGRGDAFYRSELAPRAGGLADDWDPLRYIITWGKGHSIRIHAWLNVYYVWSAEANPRDSRHVFHAHPDWIAVSKSQQSMLEEGTSRLIRRHVEGIFLAPANSKVGDHLTALVQELIAHYAPDGIHLDYIRYPGSDYDYSPAARSRFMLEYHLDPIEIVQNELFEARWMQFCRDQVSQTVSQIRAVLRQRPVMELSAAVFADQTTARRKVYQDWPGWIDRGLLDFIVIMNYAADDKTFEKNAKDAIRVLGSKTDRLMIGIAAYNQPPDGLRRKLQITGHLGIRQMSLFSHAVLQSNPQYLSVWKSVLFKN